LSAGDFITSAGEGKLSELKAFQIRAPRGPLLVKERESDMSQNVSQPTNALVLKAKIY